MEIRLTNITKSFGSKQVIAPTTLTVESGSFTTLLGSSGCGKTTLLRMIAGLETPDTGEIWFDDRCIFSKEKKIDTPPEKRGLGFVFQDFALWPHMTVFENVAFGLRAQNRTDGLRDKVMEALRSVHLEELAQRYPHQLSGGQQQRVAIARAVVTKPGVVLADEPTAGLDPEAAEDVLGLLDGLHRAGHTIILITHDRAAALRAARRLFLEGGVLSGG